MEEYKYKAVDSNGGSCSVSKFSEFYLKYNKGQKVKAPKGSLGIMVFEQKKFAMAFLSTMYNSKVAKGLVKRVIPIGKAKTPSRISAWTDDARLRVFNRLTPRGREHYNVGTLPPKGTICYPEVLVVD